MKIYRYKKFLTVFMTGLALSACLFAKSTQAQGGGFIFPGTSGAPGGSSSGSPSTNTFLCTGGGPDCLIAGYGAKQQANWLLQPTPDQANTMAGGQFLTQLLGMQFNTGNSSEPQPTDIISQLITNQLVTTLTTANGSSVAINDVTNLPSILVPPSKCGGGSSAFSFITGGTNSSANCNAKNIAMSYSLSSLLGPTSYAAVNNVDPKTAESNAQNFITWASGISNPLSVIDFTQVQIPQGSSLQQLQALPAVATYLATLRTYAAQQAVGLSNLYQFYAERVPQQGYGSQVNMPGSSSSTSESPLQVEQYVATRRINDPNWYTSMQNASPSAVSLATLFAIAEIPAMLFQIHTDLERMTATLSVMELQQTASSALTVTTQINAANTAINNANTASQNAAAGTGTTPSS